MSPRWFANRRLLAGPVVMVALGLGACGKERGVSVLLVTLDTVRADALGAYGREPSLTPNLDRLAAEGVLFEQAYSVAPLTLPAHASMLTGLFPPRHGLRDDGLAPLPSAAVTLAERALEQGYQTAAFLGSAVLDEGFGLEQGFERYEAPARRFYQQPGLGGAERPAQQVAELASQWLRARDPERPFFLWAHLWDAHAPYQPSADLFERAGGDPYLGEVAADDVALGRLLATLRNQHLDDSTLVIVVGDHGESFLDHQEFSHGAYVWNTTLKVPLILRHAGGEDAGRRVATIASVADVYPTALAAMGIALSDGERRALDGVSLFEAPPGELRGIYFESYHGYFAYGWHPLTGWLDRKGKFVHSASERFYELDSDPLEEHDLAVERGSALRVYREQIEAVSQAPALARDAEGVDPELRRALQAVGYSALSGEGAHAPGVLERLELPDPAEGTAEQLDYQRAMGLLETGSLAAAETPLRRIVSDNPGHLAAWRGLALCRMRANRHAQAIDPLEYVLSRGPGNADTWADLGACRVVTGQEEKAVAAFTHALEIDPNQVQALGGLLQLMEGAGLGSKAAPLRERFQAAQSRP